MRTSRTFATFRRCPARCCARAYKERHRKHAPPSKQQHQRRTAHLPPVRLRRLQQRYHNRLPAYQDAQEKPRPPTTSTLHHQYPTTTWRQAPRNTQSSSSSRNYFTACLAAVRASLAAWHPCTVRPTAPMRLRHAALAPWHGRARAPHYPRGRCQALCACPLRPSPATYPPPRPVL